MFLLFFNFKSLKLNDSTWRNTLVVSASRRASCVSMFSRSWRRCKCLHKAPWVKRTQSSFQPLGRPPPSQAPVRAPKQAPESAADLFFMALFDQVILGCFDSQVLHIDSGKRLMWPWAGKHTGTRCKTGRDLGWPELQLPSAVKQREANIFVQICHWIRCSFYASGLIFRMEPFCTEVCWRRRSLENGKLIMWCVPKMAALLSWNCILPACGDAHDQQFSPLVTFE